MIISDGQEIKCDAITLRAIRDAMETLSGNWKLQILLALGSGPKRFRQIAKEISGISDKMLSKELKALETNLLVTRVVYDTFPPTVEYRKTNYTDSLYEVMLALRNWGLLHRKTIGEK
ncbi:helix-turn-helix transcriptional regulator [Mucilaginibacter robiniae]|uniref:Helix-turn-helix transcriptional regulator n=1 Tax=Mucilaginibacter robiniae TaxID=2728022 RepID=A0A7L5E3K0_9SPHI|nr:helix-turn-helix domain-containing protein [Mucilaginibacter robiniae]QJD96224.1 helix-turn-helix transcriptional regulator [Mucilaginibacter robiniae]